MKKSCEVIDCTYWIMIPVSRKQNSSTELTILIWPLWQMADVNNIALHLATGQTESIVDAELYSWK